MVVGQFRSHANLLDLTSCLNRCGLEIVISGTLLEKHMKGGNPLGLVSLSFCFFIDKMRDVKMALKLSQL
jgi:hypothetical protein